MIRSYRVISLFFSIGIIPITNCCNNDSATASLASSQEFSIQFIGEQTIPNETIFEGTRFGGISGIDFANNKWYAISDDSSNPIRFYELDLKFNANRFTSLEIDNVVTLLDEQGNLFTDKRIDGESIRYDTTTDKLIWSSEGNQQNGFAPELFCTDPLNLKSTKLPLPELFNFSEEKGPIPNGAIEALSTSTDATGYWFGFELPLKQDGAPPSFTENNSPVRISFINKNSKIITKQYAYNLDPVAIEPNGQNIAINGLVELLAIDDTHLLTLERSFTANITNGGNTIKLFLSSIENATNISSFSSLKEMPFTPVTKRLLLNFDTIKDQLRNNTLDNIEGMSFGPKLENGNITLVFASDNNFNAFGVQINQFLAFELIGDFEL